MNKILFVGSFLSHRDGSLSFGESLSNKLQDNGIQNILVSFSQNKFKRMLEIIYATIVFRGKVVHIDVFSDLAFRIAEIVSKIAVIRHKKVIITLRGGKLNEFAEANTARINHIFKRATVIQTPSMFLKDYFEKWGYTLQYRPNAIDLTRFPFDRSEIKKHSLLWVRAFTSIYNPDLAIRTLKEIHKKFPDSTLTMIGPDKGIMQKMKLLATELNITDSVTFKGPVPHSELFKYFQTHEAYLNTTSYESFGNAVVEAASCGIPIVSSSVGELPWLWEHENNILLVNELSARSFAIEVTRIFEDKKLAESLSKHARDRAEKFAWENILPQWIKLLGENNN